MQKILFLTVAGIILMLNSKPANAKSYLLKDTSTTNKLTIAEKEQGWKLLFDGKTITGWRTYQNVPGSWKVEDGMLCSEKPATDKNPDLITNDTYKDFEMSIDWKLSPQGNSGIMYMVTEKYEQTFLSGPEYQLIDDDNFPQKIEDWQKTGANYAMQPPAVKAANAPGEWNHTQIIVKNGHVEHWLNGLKVVSYELGSKEWEQQKAAGKWKDAAGYGMAKAGHIALQASHSGVDKSGVCFKNIKIKLL